MKKLRKRKTEKLLRREKENEGNYLSSRTDFS